MKLVLGSARPDSRALLIEDARDWPFRQQVTPPHAASAVHIRNLHLAFPSGQVGGSRLVLTQSTYQLQRWLDWEAAHAGAVVTADANGVALRQHVPEAFARRGPWSRIDIVESHGDDSVAPDGAGSPLSAAFTQRDPSIRRDACLRALDAAPRRPALLLALGSASMELEDVQAALDAVEEAVSLAPEWEATHFELGKAWLRADETPRAADAFAAATRLMPTFATAWSNLGAALGELERPDEALVALRRALEHDPHGHPTLNNLGVLLRDGGRLDEAEATFRQVVALAPAFVFGRYNLAQTLLLAGSYAAARLEYEAAFARDPQKSPRQACRLAVTLAATGDEDGAIAAIEEAAARLTDTPRAQALEEAERALSGLQVEGDELRKAVGAALRAVRAARSTERGQGYSS